MTDVADLKAIFGMEPERAVAYLRGKGYAITRDWHEMLGRAHAKAFTVAHVAKLDILQDIHQGLIAGLAEGQTERRIARNLEPVLRAKGWWGKDIDPETGEITETYGDSGRPVRYGSPARLKTIIRTNLQSSYMAGRYEALKENAEDRPFWMYVVVDDLKVRPSHFALREKVFRHDDPVWRIIFPPNGFGCRCRVRALTESQVRTIGLQVLRGESFTIQRAVGSEDTGGRLVDVQGVRVLQADGRPLAGLNGRPLVFVPDTGFDHNAGADWLRPFTPPPLDDLPQSFPTGVALPEMLPATHISPDRLLPEGLPDEEYARRFLREFGADIDNPQVHFDVADDPLTISADLFKRGDGKWKSNKGDRGRYLLVLAETIKAPDEIWLRWEESRAKPGTWLLKRRYLKLIDIGRDTHGIGVFEWALDGWVASTLFTPSQATPEERRAYFERQRDGFLRYRRRK